MTLTEKDTRGKSKLALEIYEKNLNDFASLFLQEPIKIAKKYNDNINIVSRITINGEEFALLTFKQLAIIKKGKINDTD